jgi:hypothetical protein
MERSSVIVSSKGKNKPKKQTTKNPTNQNTTKQINPKFKCNTVSVSPSTFSPSSVIVSSKDEKNNNNKKVWRQLCECLSWAAAHLPPTVSLLLLQALFMKIGSYCLQIWIF